jgi:hypothetical protein
MENDLNFFQKRGICAFANPTFNLAVIPSFLCTAEIIHAKSDTVVIAKIVLGKIPVQMLLANVVVDTAG